MLPAFRTSVAVHTQIFQKSLAKEYTLNHTQNPESRKTNGRMVSIERYLGCLKG